MKPNIRGFTRSNMRPGIFGWKAKVSGQDYSLIVEYRMPLRNNWLIRMTKNPQAAIIQSRSGLIHLVRPVVDRSQGDSFGNSPFNSTLAAFAALAIVIAIPLIWVISQLDTQQTDSKKGDSQLTVKIRESPAQCLENDSLSISSIQNALSGFPSKLNILERSASVELGGYRVTLITVDCQSKRFRLKITEAKFKSRWILKKTVRLEN